jgi:hypothetical protein
MGTSGGVKPGKVKSGGKQREQNEGVQGAGVMRRNEEAKRESIK